MNLGILGGMGPLSSAAFMCTLYECGLDGRAEQDMPAAILLSDPTLPDRTRVFLSGDHGALRDAIERGLQRLLKLGCDELIMCCFTAHQMVPLLSSAVQARLRSLLDATLTEIARSSGHCLILCSSATRKLGLLERQPGWAEVASRCILPNEMDQDHINSMIFKIKSHGGSAEMAAALDDLVARYAVENAVIACSELHMLNRTLEKHGISTAYRRLDPLSALAHEICHRAARRR